MRAREGPPSSLARTSLLLQLANGTIEVNGKIVPVVTVPKHDRFDWFAIGHLLHRAPNAVHGAGKSVALSQTVKNDDRKHQ